MTHSPLAISSLPSDFYLCQDNPSEESKIQIYHPLARRPIAVKPLLRVGGSPPSGFSPPATSPTFIRSHSAEYTQEISGTGRKAGIAFRSTLAPSKREEIAQWVAAGLRPQGSLSLPKTPSPLSTNVPIWSPEPATYETAVKAYEKLQNTCNEISRLIANAPSPPDRALSIVNSVLDLSLPEPRCAGESEESKRGYFERYINLFTEMQWHCNITLKLCEAYKAEKARQTLAPSAPLS